MTPLAKIIREEMRERGPMDLGRYMALCLGHPEYGYYMTRDPFGVKGDFTTAPEISQIFGEMIGVWLADTWEKMGAPANFILLECGPGRGTLMADALRATKNVAGFHAALALHLLEMSPVLRQAQEEALKAHNPVWHAGLESVPEDMPLLVIGNEFLDALPVHQLVRQKDGWAERTVEPAQGGGFALGAREASQEMIALVPPSLLPWQDRDVVEVSPILIRFLKSLCFRLKKQKGSALFIDYGYMSSAAGETLQAVHKHRPVSILDAPGQADITAHVNFETIGTISMAEGVTVHGPVPQGAFLERLGAGIRAAALCNNATESQEKDIAESMNRLCAKNRMGTLFKALAICDDPALDLSGFQAVEGP
ncbi:MAG: SAM-dependent methyltransferase [Rhodospirillales bacterium]|nr:SAM-dependent methyltransferase [Alphaproteobacteria bacterium]USO03520.1 MAG: SAM-dependent methyltransferase [Rhodospirillales bacterium]